MGLIKNLLRFVSGGLTEEDDVEGVMEVLNELFKKDEVNIKTIDVIRLLSSVKSEQADRMPHIHRRRTPLGVYDPVTGRYNTCEPQHQPWMNAGLAAHYLLYAGGAYGSSHLYALKDKEAVLQWSSDKIRHKSGSPPPNIDDKTMANTEIIKKVTGLADKDLIYVTYQDDIKRKPFFIGLDHKHKSVVVAIRGSRGKFDWLTNFTIVESDDLPLELCGGVAGATTHKGMLEAARDLRMRLIGEEDETFDKGLLAKAWRTLRDRHGLKVAQEYKLVLTGHSLGGGVAAILAILMKQDYPDLKCFAFAVPACLMSEQAAEYCSPFVLSVLLGDDIVGRASVHSGFTLKIALLKILKDDPRKAYQNFFKSSKQLKEQIDQIDELIADSVRKMDDIARMYLPGCIMYVEEIVTGINRKKTFAQYFCSRKEAILSEILLSQHVISHHVVWRLLEGLEYLKDPPTEEKDLKDVAEMPENALADTKSNVDNGILNIGLTLSNPSGFNETSCIHGIESVVQCQEDSHKKLDGVQICTNVDRVSK